MNSSPIHPLSVLFWNANSLSNQINELREYVTENNIDVILIQETKLPSFLSVKISNYIFYHTDRPTTPGISPQGGTGIYIKQNIPHFQLTTLPLQSLEATSIVITINQTNILISSIYVRHGISFPIADLNSLFSYSNKCIIAGDFNARHRFWNCANNNTYGNALKNFLFSNPSLSLHIPPSFTHYSTGLPSTIDLAISKSFPSDLKLEVETIFHSDHLPVIISIPSLCYSDPPIQRTRTDWTLFNSILRSRPVLYPSIRNTSDIDQAVTNLTDNINSALLGASTPLPYNNSYALPLAIRLKIRERNSARRLFQFSRDPNDLRRFKILRNQITNSIRNYKKEKYDEHIASISEDITNAWTALRRIKKTIHTYPPIHGRSGSMAFSTAAKAEAIADTYELQFSPNEDIADDDHDQQVINTVYNFHNTSTPTPLAVDRTHTPPAKPSEVLSIIKKLNPKKAPGPDGINNRAIKNLPFNFIIYLTFIINAILNYNYFPKPWKTSVICPIPKPNADHKFPQNYRPISLLCSLSKIAERIFHTRLQNFITLNDIMNPEQFGFRPQHSTTHQLLRVIENASEGLQNRMHVGAIFLDVAKAFDKLWHTGLIYKMIRLNFPHNLIKLTHNYLSDRSFAVRVQHELSTTRKIRSGVPQGSVVSPLLYNLYLTDLVRNTKTITSLYADDTAIISTAKNPKFLAKHLQHHIDSLEDYFTKWKIKINPTKTQAIHFSRARTDPPRIYIDNIPIPWARSVRYLGVTLDKTLTMRPHILNTVRKMKSSVAQLRSLLFNFKINIHTRMRIYNSCILPIATYAASSFLFCCKTNIKTLERAHSSTLRRIRRAWKYLKNTVVFRDLNSSPITHIVKKQAENFYNNLYHIKNPVIAELPDYDYRNYKYRRRPRATLLLN